MGLRETVAIAIDQAFVALDNLVVPIIYNVESSQLNTSTLVVEQTVTTSYPIEKAALVRFKVSELGLPLNGERGALTANRTVVETADRKCIFRQNEVGDLEPSDNDYVVDNEGKRWNIIAYAQDPASIIWILQLRAV